MNLSQRQLQAFLHVARLSSFTRAAELLHITQSGLSAMMRDLESQLDCRLFDRTTRSVALTPAGVQLVPVAERVLRELESVSGSIDRISAQARQVLTVGVTPLVAATVMPRAGAAFTRLHPEVQLRIRDLERGDIQRGVADGSLDIGFGLFFEPAAGIERIALTEFPMLYLSRAEGKRSPKGRGSVPRITWSALRDAPLIGLLPDNPVQQLIEGHLRDIGRAHEERPAYAHLHTVLGMVEAGAGGAILPALIAPACARYRIAFDVLAEPSVSLCYYRITKKGRIGAGSGSALAAVLTEILEAAIPAASK
ncbi:MAG: LysR family transcriptional regulator [Noviherbaspirillum sp.]